jgi:uncharacterized protein DUF4253
MNVTSYARAVTIVRRAALAALWVALSPAPLAARAATGEPLALSAPRSFAAAVESVERAVGAKAEPLELGGKIVTAGEGRVFQVDSATAARLLAGSHATFLKAGVYLFRLERAFGVAGEKDRIALLATADRGQVVRRVGTSSERDKLTPDAIASWLDALAKEEPFELTEIGVDYVAGRFARVPRDPDAIAKRSAAFAPDLVAASANTIFLLAEEIRVNRTLYLMW